jgi:osmotically-inducible protein OsmY
MVLRQPASPSDEELRGAVISALARDGRIREFDVVHVDVTDGSVLLSGEVATDQEKLGASDVARRVSGVRGIDNRLTIAVNRHITDGQISRAVLAALAAQPPPLNTIGCQVASGVVTLVGRVRSVAEARLAIDLAAEVPGVEAVQSALEIRAEARRATPARGDDPTLVGRIALALSEADIYVRNHRIRVTRAIATLEGVVESDAVRQRATSVAESVEGIRAVRNRLQLAISSNPRCPGG